MVAPARAPARKEPHPSLPADVPFVRPIASRPNLAVAYFAAEDDLRLRDTVLAKDYDSPASVNEAEARNLFHRAFDALASAGLVAGENYDLTREHVGYTKYGSGSRIDGVVKETAPQISEYHFRVRRLLDNIEFANQLVRISVHVTGRISRVRLVGAEVGARVGGMSPRTMSDSALRSRFSTDYPNGVVEWDQLLYSFRGDEQRGVIEPKHVFSFSSVYLNDGVPSVSRRQEVRYSVINPDAEPEIWPVPNPDATGDDPGPERR